MMTTPQRLLRNRSFRWLLTGLAAALISACGGGSDSTAPSSSLGQVFPIDGTGTGSIPPSASYANVCTAASEKQFVRAYLNENYLWYAEIPARVAAAYPSVSDYFYGLLVTTPDSHGQPKDRFSFIVPTSIADSLSTGANIGYGVEWKADAAGVKRVTQVTAGSPAALAGMARGGQLVSVTSSNNNSWYPNTAGATVTFVYKDSPTAATRSVTLTAAPIQDNPVPLTQTLTNAQGRRVGYIAFTDHSSVAQDKLIDAVTALKAQGVEDLVLDMRYNGGGYLYVANALGSMVAGASADGKVFERLQFNDKRGAESADSAFAFSTKVQYADGGTHPEGQALPLLSLPRVYVLASDWTCSASESVINSLRGVDVNVVLIGSTTCGKPYGFTRKDNCGNALYPIEFQGTNAKGFGDYANGFAPTCSVADDFDHALGDPAERMLGAALTHITTGQCPAASSAPVRDATLALAPTGLRLGDRPAVPGKLIVGR